jgi:hypothetical protein
VPDVIAVFRALKWIRSGLGLTPERIALPEARALFVLADTPRDVLAAIAAAVEELGPEYREAASAALGVGPKFEDPNDPQRRALEVRRDQAGHRRSTWTPKENQAFEHLARKLTGDWKTPIDRRTTAESNAEVADAIAAEARKIADTDGSLAGDGELLAGLAEEVANLARRDIETADNVYSLRLDVARHLAVQIHVTNALTAIDNVLMGLVTDLGQAKGRPISSETVQSMISFAEMLESQDQLFNEVTEIYSSVSQDKDDLDEEFELRRGNSRPWVAQPPDSDLESP